MKGRYRFVIAGLLFVAGGINYMDRAALGIVAPLLRKDLHLSPSQMGMVFSSFFIGYSLFSFIGGQLADRFGPRRVYSWAMGTWSLICGLTAAVSGFTTLLLCRMFFGAGEGPMNTTTNRTITHWFPREETGSMVGFTFSGQTFGNAISAPIIGLVAIAYGWRVSFVIIAVVGFGWIFLWRALASDLPAQNRFVSKEEARMIQESRASVVPVEGGDDKVPLRSYLTRPSILALAAGLFAGNYTFNIYLTWLPSYFTDAIHLDMKHMSILTSIPWLFGAIGWIGGGVAADFLYRHMSNGVLARKIAAIVPLFVAGLTLLVVSSVHTTFAAVSLIALSLLCITSSSQAVWSLEHEMVPSRHLGGVGGFIHLLSNVSGLIGPTIMGFAVQYLGGYSSALLLSAAICGLGVLAMSFFVKTSATPQASAVSHL
jgi:MFS family permease